MSNTEMRSKSTVGIPRAGSADMKVEMVVIAVSDIDRAEGFHGDLTWSIDNDCATEDHEGHWRAPRYKTQRP